MEEREQSLTYAQAKPETISLDVSGPVDDIIGNLPEISFLRQMAENKREYRTFIGDSEWTLRVFEDQVTTLSGETSEIRNLMFVDETGRDKRQFGLFTDENFELVLGVCRENGKSTRLETPINLGEKMEELKKNLEMKFLADLLLLRKNQDPSLSAVT